MKLNVEIQEPSSVLRKLKITIPAEVVQNSFNKELAMTQKTAHLKGFRQGQAPISIIKHYYGDEIKHRLYHDLTSTACKKAIEDFDLQPIGNPTLDDSGHSHSHSHSHDQAQDHSHHVHSLDHALDENQDFTFQATVEILPKIHINHYTGIVVTSVKREITDEHLHQALENLRESQAQLVPVSEGAVLSEGEKSSRSVQKDDFVEVEFSGGLVQDEVVQLREDMKGTQIISVGSKTWIPGFEDQLIGMHRGETKTFRLFFPKDYSQTELAEKESEFTVTVHEKTNPSHIFYYRISIF